MHELEEEPIDNVLLQSKPSLSGNDGTKTCVTKDLGEICDTQPSMKRKSRSRLHSCAPLQETKKSEHLDDQVFFIFLVLSRQQTTKRLLNHSLRRIRMKIEDIFSQM